MLSSFLLFSFCLSAFLPLFSSFFQITTQEVAGLSVRSFEYSDEVEKRGWYLLFIFFWTTQFIVAMGQIVVALTVVKYYFTRDVETVSERANEHGRKAAILYVLDLDIPQNPAFLGGIVQRITHRCRRNAKVSKLLFPGLGRETIGCPKIVMQTSCLSTR